LKILTLWATLKKIFENVGYTDFGSINDWMMQKMFKTDYENLVHVYLYEQSFVEFIGKSAKVA
jgi:hypothetical protein